ncbi:MAG: LamG-like jellyroll fold domain-containing protein [Bacteroidales bacterium]
MIKRFKILIPLLLLTLGAGAQTGQLPVARIDRMPDLPAPLLIRDWDSVARCYDRFVFDLGKSGQYLPLARLGTPGQFNYSENIPLFLDTYVGAVSHPNQAEAINILPAIIGAGLIGINKSDQDGMNWAAKARDFFNLRNGQMVYLNNYSARSGSDWWYDLMPNVYFHQLRWLYPDAAPEFSQQFITVADRWLWAVHQLGGATAPWQVPNMNYRAFNLATGLPLATGVPEPESAGSIAWLLYNTYLETSNHDYFLGAQLALDFLSGWSANPSYELQLPYGTLAAARMNAVEGTDYPIQKFLDWCFDRGNLRGWGAIVGNWGGYDVSGLIGEANDQGNDYAFIMNGFQQAAALAPLPKYDKRYARAIAKWILNLANASRLLYWNALPAGYQDSFEWASQYDPEACIPYESMKEIRQGRSPFATGDALNGGWAATNLSLYSGSSVGFLAAVIDSTRVPEILRIDLNCTDFYGDVDLASFLYFNPTDREQTVDCPVPPGQHGVYEAITETLLDREASGTIPVRIPSGEVRLIRFWPAGLDTLTMDSRLLVGPYVLDYHYRYNFDKALRVKALVPEKDSVAINSTFQVFCQPGNAGAGEVIFEWFLNGELITTQGGSAASFTAPALPAEMRVRCQVSQSEQSGEDSVLIRVVERLPDPPVITGIVADQIYTPTSGVNTFTVQVEPGWEGVLEYRWNASIGVLQVADQSTVTWIAPPVPTVAQLSVVVTNQDRLSATASLAALVKDTLLPTADPLLWYPFDEDDRNQAADQYHAVATGVTRADDPRGMPQRAYRFASGSDLIHTPNHPGLNFTDAISLSCWLKCEQFGSERFVLSHGSWQQRYKLSVIPDGRLRWTVKTGTGVADLDSPDPIGLNRWYHVTTLYTGYSMELYLDGGLVAFRSFSGPILQSDKPLTVGRMDDIETQYGWRGSIDEVRLWDREIPVGQIRGLKGLWIGGEPIDGELIDLIYPNPAKNGFFVRFTGEASDARLTLFDLKGKIIRDIALSIDESPLFLATTDIQSGLYLLRLLLPDGRQAVRKVLIAR